MAISSNRYVNITSAVGGGDLVPTRELLLRLYSTNEQIPTGAVLNFSSASLGSELLDFFGGNSEEYRQASYYFGFISKVATSPKNIQFARWTDEDSSAQVMGSPAVSIADLNAYTDESFKIDLNGTVFDIVDIDLSGATTYANIRDALQDAIQLEIASATVEYVATPSLFNFSTNGVADGTISFYDNDDFLNDLGWGDDATFSAGIEAESVTDVLNNSTSLNNNFGSFDFIPDLSDSQIEERAIFANGRNVEFINFQRVQYSNRAARWDLVKGYASTGLVLSPILISSEYPQLLPAAILASLDYDKPSASANFMYYQDDRLTPSVLSDSEANINDNLEVNYMGLTQEAGTQISFFQRGILTGGATAPKAMGVHANEQWLKSYLKSQFLNMFLALQQVSADESGEAISRSYLDTGVSKALGNSAISVGKTLTTTQINYITKITGYENAWQDVQSIGYWYSVTLDATTNEMSYLLIYSKRDSVDKVEGRHSLI